MSIKVTCKCGAVYDLKDELAGTAVQCPKCGAGFTVPAAPIPVPRLTERGAAGVRSGLR